MTNKMNVAMSLTVVTFMTMFSCAQFAFADTTNLGATADALCVKQCAQQKVLADKQKNQSLNCPTLGTKIIACSATAPGGGVVNGHCVYGIGCKGDTASGTNGKSMSLGDLSGLLSGIGSIMKALGGGSSGGSGSGGTGSTPTGASGCTQYYQVSTPSSDPCAYYVPQTGASSINLNAGTPTSGSGTGISDIGAGTDTSGSNPISNLISNLLGGDTTNTNTNDNTNNVSSTITSTSTGISSSTAQGATGVGPQGPGGANGEIRILPNGATIVITNQNNSGNSVTAGFLGAQTTGGSQPTGIAATWCRTRPWAGNFLSFIIPATFLDSLCALRGYQVGETTFAGGPAEIGGASLSQTPITQPYISPTNYVQGAVPQTPPVSAEIWAAPSSVPLGGRTTIFWNSKNAASCTETSPDGSFSHTSLAGGGATVPLSGATTFTISCMAPDGTHTTADVVVGLSL